MANASVVWRSDDKEVIASLQKMEKEVERLRDENRKLKEIGKEAMASAKAGAEGASSAYGKLTESIEGMVSGYLSVNAALELGNKLLQDKIDLQNKAADAQHSGAIAERSLLRNLGNISVAEQDKFLAGIKTISQETGVSQDMLKGTAAEAVSARGNLNFEQTLQHIKQAALMAPESASEQAATSRALMNAASITGSANQENNQAFLTDLMGQSPSSRLADISQNMMPGIAGVKGFGGTAQEAGALNTAMASAMKDATGASSGTAAIQLAKQIEKYTPGGAADDIKYLQEHEAERKAFLAKASFEAKATAPSKDILTPGTDAAKLFAQNMQSFTPVGKEGEAARAYINRLNATPLQQAENFRRKFATESETRREEDLRSGDYARIRNAIEETASSAGIGYGERTMAQKMAQIRGFADSRYGRDANDNGLVQLGLLKDSIANNRESGYSTPAEAEKQLNALKSIEAVLKEQTQALKEIGGNQKQRQLNVNAHSE